MTKLSNVYSIPESVIATAREIHEASKKGQILKAPVETVIKEDTTVEKPAEVKKDEPGAGTGGVAPEARKFDLVELSRGAYMRYISKAARSSKDREKGIDKAAAKADKPKSEDQEADDKTQLQELSRGKLMRYVAKAARSSKDREKGIDKADKKIDTAKEEIELSDAEKAKIEAALNDTK